MSVWPRVGRRELEDGEKEMEGHGSESDAHDSDDDKEVGPRRNQTSNSNDSDIQMRTNYRSTRPLLPLLP